VQLDFLGLWGSPKTRAGCGFSGAHASQRAIFVEQNFLAAKNAGFVLDKLGAGTLAALLTRQVAEACVHAVRKLRGISNPSKILRLRNAIFACLKPRYPERDTAGILFCNPN
jgi:hypothetical protein